LSACSRQCSDSAAQTGAFLVLGVAYVHGALGQQTNVPTPPTTLTPTYDDDGNTLTDGTGKVFVWDAENRLTQVTLPNNEIVRYYYDTNSHRVKREHITPTKTETTTYLHDGWNVIHEPTTTTETQNGTTSNILSTKSYIWGLDLSDALQGAGGVGGLLITKHMPNSTLPTQNSLYHHTYDANGNTSELLDVAGDAAAHYEYDAFGKETVTTGAFAITNTYQFGTKLSDHNTNLHYYGYRFFNLNTGRWLNRDGIYENGGMNLYSFLANNGVTHIDYLGLKMTESSCQNYANKLIQEGGKGFPAIAGVLKELRSHKCVFNVSCVCCDATNNPCAPADVERLGGCARNGAPEVRGGDITICANNNDQSSLPAILAHELTHILQFCGGTRIKDPCENSICMEIQAYLHDGRCQRTEDTKQCVIDGVMYSSAGSCLPANPTEAQREALKNKIIALYGKCNKPPRYGNLTSTIRRVTNK
jgi:RHS repeat-associated protein